MDAGRLREIEELYYAALRLAPDGRAALLARAASDVRSEVESLFAQDSGMAFWSCGSPIIRPPVTA